CQQYSDLLYTF
nr:immunoglobulin light chain junction region [Macaca mulatta]